MKIPATGLVTRIVDPNGNTVTITHANGKPVEVTDATGRKVELKWTGNQLAEIVDGNASQPLKVSYRYDAYGNPIGVTDLMGRETQYKYDGQRQLVQVIDNRGTPFDISYVDGRVVSMKSPLSAQHISCDFVQGVTTVTEMVNGALQTATYRFDNSGRVIAKSGTCCSPDAEFSYDLNNQVVQTKDPAGFITTYQRDQRGNVTMKTDPLGNSIEYTYDPVYSKVISIKDKKGAVDYLPTRWTG